MAKEESVEIEIREVVEVITRDNGGSIMSGSAPRINQIAPTQAVNAISVGVIPGQAPRRPRSRTCGGVTFKILFFVHLIGLAVLISFLSFRAFFSKYPSFDPFHYFIPLLSSVTLSPLTALAFLLFALRHPKRCFNTSLWLSPVLTCLAGALLLLFGTAVSFALGVPTLLLGLALSFYACWVGSRIHHAHQVLYLSVLVVPFCVAVGKHVTIALVAAVVYSWFWVLGIGALAASNDTRFNALYVLLLLISLSWTMQVIRNLVHVAVSDIAYSVLAQGSAIPAHIAFRIACGEALGEVCIGSVLVPMVGSIRAMARGMDLVSGDSDEFLFSCAGCSLGVADRLVGGANRWGFVRVGVGGRGFVEASEETWGMFAERGMCRLIDADLTGSFCFFCGAAGGSFAALGCGSWMLAVDEGYATGPTVYAFLIGYFLVRIGMAWIQACVSAYHVVYAEDPQSSRLLGSVITERIRELELPLD